MDALLDCVAQVNSDAAVELRMFLAHYQQAKAAFKLTVEFDGSGGQVSAVWVGPRRFKVGE